MKFLRKWEAKASPYSRVNSSTDPMAKSFFTSLLAIVGGIILSY